MTSRREATATVAQAVDKDGRVREPLSAPDGFPPFPDIDAGQIPTDVGLLYMANAADGTDVLHELACTPNNTTLHCRGGEEQAVKRLAWYLHGQGGAGSLTGCRPSLAHKPRRF